MIANVHRKPSLAALGLLHLIARREGQPTTRRELATITERRTDTIDILIRRLVAEGHLVVVRTPGKANTYVVTGR